MNDQLRNNCMLAGRGAEKETLPLLGEKEHSPSSDEYIESPQTQSLSAPDRTSLRKGLTLFENRACPESCCRPAKEMDTMDGEPLNCKTPT